MDDVVYKQYRQLAATAIVHGVNDYLSGRDSDADLEEWVWESDFFEHLCLNRLAFIARVKYLKRKGIKRIGGARNYARKKDEKY